MCDKRQAAAMAFVVLASIGALYRRQKRIDEETPPETCDEAYAMGIGVGVSFGVGITLMIVPGTDVGM